MEEDSSAKAAPVTRLRRRLSVEPEDSPLPTTPSTPSKKRSTRLATKPQLELIDEVASENVPKRTTRKTLKEVESESTGTPIPVTPSRRSTRVRSNTSLLSETIAQSVESPRAKRALRRNSQLGSDNESAAPITPARQTRRTRKDSTTSVDKQAAASEENITVLTITSTETTAKKETQKDLKTHKDKSGSPTLRKSPRLKQKSGDTDETDNIHIETAVHSTQDKNPVVPITSAKDNQTENITSIITTKNPKEIKTEIKMLSTSSVNLINDMKTSDKKTTYLNKSTTSIDKPINDLKNKRNRTKSWTTLSASPINVGLTDDKEDSSEKLIARYRTMSGSGDGIQHSGNSSKLEELKIKSPSKSINKSKTSLLNTSTENNENIVVSEKPVEPYKTDTMKLFENSPLGQKPLVLIEDSDSGSYDKLVMDIQIEGEDQCVPVGKSANQTRKDSLEPMDIDETMPENVTIDDFSDKSNASKGEIEVPEKRKSSTSETSLLKDKSIIKSKRKSSISKQASDNTQNSSENAIENNESRNDSVTFREEKIENLNESKIKSSVSQTELGTSQNESGKTPKKSSISIDDEKVQNQNANDSKIIINKDDSSNSLNKSTRKTAPTLESNIEILDESNNKSKKNVSITQSSCELDQVDKSLNKHHRKSSTSIVDDNLEKLYDSCNIVSGCLNKSVIKLTEEANSKSLNKSHRKTSLSLSKENSSENVNECSNKSNRKSFNSQTNSFMEENNDSNSANKSKRTSSHSQPESPRLEKSGNENKSTLVLSQLKDVSTNDSSNITSQIQTNELSKSVSGSEVKNKALDNINLTPKNYLTSTPIQQKSLQKMVMQINTSIISPAVENKNVTIEETKLNGIDEEKKIKNKKIFSRALSSSASSDEETLAIKQSQNKKPALDSSKSETKTESPRKNKNKKIPQRVQALDSSSDEDSDIVKKKQNLPKTQNNESKYNAKIVKTPNKKTPVSNNSDSEESEKVSKDKNNVFDNEASDSSSDYESGDIVENQQTIPKTLNNESKVNAKKAKIPNKKTPVSNNSDSEDSEEVSKDKNNVFDNEASDSSSDYESGDIVENQQTIPKTLNNESKVNAKKAKIPNKNTPVSNNSDSEESEEVSKDKNKVFDNEASEASSDYESGDSRSDKERQYEDDNEILEKGETLESDEELSNDSDYEKDSFIVSSDPEDNEMLSGTGDDLSMSDNELTMSAKSKKKFNERKLKQQKKASREMYEARHENDSAVSSKAETSKSKKSKRQRLVSSTLESENEAEQMKKKSRLRIDSSQDSVNSANESIRIKKKKSKRLSESVCETTMNEKEISLFNQTTEKKDPLTAAIKLEPKTPQKGFNISTVAINDNIEEMLVDSNASIMKNSDSLDPLQATMGEDNENDEDSLSENNEIIENYDSILNNLNLQTNKLKTRDISLDLNNKVKKAKNPVIDQLNLTQTKKSHKNKVAKNQQTEPVNSKSKENFGMEEEDYSDSIDMKLLFPEDSNDSEVNASKFKPEGNVRSEPETIIPLKRTEAKTNLLDKTDMNISLNESSLNGIKKKNKKRKTSQSSQPEESMILDNGIKIIVDTIGTHEEVDFPQEPLRSNSSKKKIKKNKSLNETAGFEMSADIDCTDGFTPTEVETSIKSEKKKKKNKNKSFDESTRKETSINVSGSQSEKKSRNISQSTSDFIETTVNREETMMDEILVNTSIKSEKKKKNKDTSVVAEAEMEAQSAKKKSKKISISEDNKSHVHEETIIEEVPVNTSIKSEKKKKKSASVIAESGVETQSAKKKSKMISISEENKSQAIHEETIIEEIPVNTSIKSENKKKKSASVITEPDIETQSAKKKTKKISISEENKSQAIHEETIIEEIPVNTSIKSENKKKKSASVITEPDVETQSAKKKTKKISISEENKSQAIHEETIIEEIPVNTSIKSEKKKKKSASFIAEPDVETQSAKKKSKKISISEENKSQAIHDESDDAPEEVSYKSAKKSDATDNVADDAVTTSTEKKFKKKKNKNIAQSDKKLDVANAPTDQEDSELRKRKRKVSNNPTETDDAANVISLESVPTRNEKKKRKVNLDDDYAAAYDNNAQSNENDTSAKKSKKDKSKKHHREDISQNNAKKRKNRENEDSVEKISKVSKQDSFDEIHVPRLPETILKQLTEKPAKTKKPSATAISTMDFLVEKGGRKNKPSEYLEQSVYLNNSPVKKKKHAKLRNPKVLPFTPTALTSDNGCTSRFNISLLPKDIQFVAQASNVENFKEAFLGTQRIKKMRTLERCKIQRSHKLSKF